MSPAHKLFARCTNAYMYMYMYSVVLPCFDEDAVLHCYKCFNAKGCASVLENKKIVLHNKACGFTNFMRSCHPILFSREFCQTLGKESGFSPSLA